MQILKKTTKNLRRSPYQSLSAFLMTAVTFFVVSIFAVLVYSTHELLVFFESRPQVTAFLLDSTTTEEVETLKNSLVQESFVKELSYISKDDALELYRQENQDNPLLLEMVTADILPASLEVSATSVKDLELIAERLTDSSLVEEVVYQKDVADTLKKWVDGIRVGGLVLTSLFLLGSLVTIVVILGMRVSMRKTEIKTLALLGATSSYIRAPFVFEGLTYTLVGAVLGWGSAYLSLLYLTPNFLDFFAETSIFPIPWQVMLIILGGQLVLALLLGFIASFSATKRYR
jgi:cell division transport system permease protein